MEFCYNGRMIKRAAVFGLGRSNAGVIEYLKKRYPKIDFTLRSDTDIPIEEAMRVTNFKKILTKKDALASINEDIIFLSPTVKRERFSGCCAILSSDAELFFKTTKSCVLAVSGSDGKSTTATLSSLMIRNSGKECSCIGNVGEAMAPHIDDENDAVVELSSFQLKHLSCDFGRTLLTNITPNHLDWHGTFDDYVDSKATLVKRAKEPILNIDDEVSRSLIGSTHPFALFSLKMKEEEIKSYKAELYGYIKDGYLCVNGNKILHTGAILSKNSYNVANFLAAILLTHGKANKDGVYRTAREFQTLRHRCELIYEKDGISYIDSSIDSTPQRCITTLTSLKKRVSIIIGGRSKGLDYSILTEHLIKYASAVTLTGESGAIMLDILKRDGRYTEAKIPTEYIPVFEEAVLCALKYAKEGDTVLLSPASTSYDSFKNFEDRGDKFKEIITNFYRGS